MKSLEQRQVFYCYFLNFLHVGKGCKFKWQGFTDTKFPLKGVGKAFVLGRPKYNDCPLCLRQGNIKSKSVRAKWLHRPELIWFQSNCFLSDQHFLLLPGWDAIHQQGYHQHKIHWYWIGVSNMRGKFLVQERNSFPWPEFETQTAQS